MPHNTLSLCPTCYQRVEATIVERDGAVIMEKQCATCGTFTEATVETDAVFYNAVNALPNNEIYDGLLVDITDACNLDCAICLHDKSSGQHCDPHAVAAYCEQNKALQPFFLSGGEPTAHPEFFRLYHEVSKIGGVGVITNGIKFTGLEYMRKFAALVPTDVLPIALSIHPETDVLDAVCANLRALSKKLSAVFWVIDDLATIPTIIDTFRKYEDVLDHIRIKAATNIWNTQGLTTHIFVSDMLRFLSLMGEVSIDTSKGNKPSVVNVMFEGLKLMLVSWYNVHNIDLNDIDCPPYYTAKDGVTRDFVYSCLINEGMSKGIL